MQYREYNTEILNRIKDVEKQILCKYIEICEKYHLRYFVAFGTLLGTVRHKGFIPWDDDIDVGMPREDYEKFLKNELFLDSQKQIKAISPKVEKMMNDIDFEAESIKRVRIFKQYEKVLKNFNNIQLDLNSGDIPYCYPFSPNSEIIKRKLWSKNLVLLQLWKNFPKSFIESEFLNDTIALPLDNAEYAEKIIEIIN